MAATQIDKLLRQQTYDTLNSLIQCRKIYSYFRLIFPCPNGRFLFHNDNLQLNSDQVIMAYCPAASQDPLSLWLNISRQTKWDKRSCIFLSHEVVRKYQQRGRGTKKRQFFEPRERPSYKAKTGAPKKSNGPECNEMNSSLLLMKTRVPSHNPSPASKKKKKSHKNICNPQNSSFDNFKHRKSFCTSCDLFS